MAPGPDPLSAEEHYRRGTFRRDRHAVDPEANGDGELQYDRNGEPIDRRVVLSDEDRARAGKGLTGFAREVFDGVLNVYWDWDVSSLFTLRCYALSCARVKRLQDAAKPNMSALHRELEINLALRQASRQA